MALAHALVALPLIGTMATVSCTEQPTPYGDAGLADARVVNDAGVSRGDVVSADRSVRVDALALDALALDVRALDAALIGPDASAPDVMSPDQSTTAGGGCRDPQPASILLCSDWELSDFDAQKDVKRSLSHPNLDWVEISSAKQRAGQKSLRIYLDYDGPDAAEFRSEISDHNGPSAPLVLGVAYWIGFSVYVPADWQPEMAGWDNQVMWQTHTSSGAPSNTSPGTAVRIRNKNWVASLKFNLDDGAGVQTRSKTLGPVVPGRWNDFVVKVRYAIDGSGYLKVWKDQRAGDTPLWDYAGPTTSVGDTGGYNKFGLYHTGWKFNVPTSNKVRTYYLDEIRIGNANASFDLVAPGR